MNDLTFFSAAVGQHSRRGRITAYGIDLGTTNSVVAKASWEPGNQLRCEVLEIDQPLFPAGSMTSPLVPSIVADLGNGSVLVGEGAKRLRTRPQDANLFPERNLFYETKNDMGLRKTYHRAAESFNHASKIAGHILGFLKDAVNQQVGDAVADFCVTVPASFQLNQRRDTLRACQYAGIDLEDEDLLDEPTTALIDYFMTEGTPDTFKTGKINRCVVFDFGGGTCDVAVMEITADRATKQLQINQLAVSRYHRLGGGDLDAAIVYNHLIPRLCEENGIDLLDLKWAEKKRGLEPQLRGTAEALKEALCKQIDRLKRFNKYDHADKKSIEVRQPGLTVYLGQRTLTLSRPSLNADQWEKILEPFFDEDILYARETEYYLVQSILAPLQDALERAGKKPKDIDFCLMVGGSSLIPQVREKVDQFFHKAAIGFFQDPMDIQLSVARGAAWSRLYKAMTGKNLVQPVLHDGLALVTAGDRLLPIVPAHTPLPYPKDNKWGQVELVAAGNRRLDVDRLQFKVVTEREHQVIFHQVWKIPGSVSTGSEIIMEYRITGGKQFQCRAFLRDDPQTVFEHTEENPFVNVVNPNQIRLLIEEKEEELKQKNPASPDNTYDYVQIAKWCAELKQYERALDWLRLALKNLGKPDAEILNLQALYFRELGNLERAEKFYREADQATPHWDGPLFNLTLLYLHQARHQEALQTIEDAIKKGGEDGPNLTLKARCLERAGVDAQKCHAIYRQAVKAYGRLETMPDWELGWYAAAVKSLGDEEALELANKEIARRKRKGKRILDTDAPLPGVKGGSLARRSG